MYTLDCEKNVNIIIKTDRCLQQYSTMYIPDCEANINIISQTDTCLQLHNTIYHGLW